jgi:hypothetical protein
VGQTLPRCHAGDSEVDIRQVLDMEDFAPTSTSAAGQERMWTQVAAKKVYESRRTLLSSPQ